VADSPYEWLAQDRIGMMLDRNDSLSQSMAGLTSGLLSFCDEKGIDPVSFRVSRPWLRWITGDTGVIRMRYWRGRRGSSRYHEAFGMDGFMHGINRATVEFFRSCRNWRSAVEAVHEIAWRFARDGGQSFEELEFGIGRFNDSGQAWLRVYRKPDDRTADERLVI